MEAEGYRSAIRLKANAVLERHIALETTESHLSDLFRDRPETGKVRSRSTCRRADYRGRVSSLSARRRVAGVRYYLKVARGS